MIHDNRSEGQMSERPLWHLDAETAKRECRTCLDKWQGQIERLRQLVENSDAFAPDALRVSFEESMPEMKRAAQAAIARFQILVQIRAGTMRWHQDEPTD
jgi:hypothetical protein